MPRNMSKADAKARLVFPINLKCPHCSMKGETYIEYTRGRKTYIWAVAICLLGGFLGCCIIPFYTKCSLYGKHFCPNCDEHITNEEITRMANSR